MKKCLKITGIIVLVLLLAFGVFAFIWYNGKSYKDFYTHATKEFEVPGLDDGLVPQGLDYHEESQNFFVSGYMKEEDSASRIYVVGDQVKYFTLKLDGEDFFGHAGGVAVYGDYGYLVGDKKLQVFNINDALALENGQSLDILASFDAPNGADFINIQDGKVYLGEFYHEKKYPTSENHHITTSDNQTNYAITFVYNIQDSNSVPYHFDINNPSFAISTTEKIQGLCLSPNGKIVLSSSWSIPDSHLLVYKPFSQIEPQTFTFNDSKDIDLYVLDGSNLLKSLVLPSMSEEVTLLGNKVFIIFENACTKWKLITRHKNTHAYSFDINKLLET